MTTPQQTCLKARETCLEVLEKQLWSLRINVRNHFNQYRPAQVAEIYKEVVRVEAAIAWVKEQAIAPFPPKMPESKNVEGV